MTRITNVRSADFETSAASYATCPPSGLPEFPFIGRSNVGKSSLINMLAGRKALAKISSRPGHTQLINFFAINTAWRIVDLPGYGYVKLPKGTKEQFASLISDYLMHRAVIKKIFVLIDSRLDPQEIDLQFVSWLAELQRPFVLVFTKSDKLKPAAVDKNVAGFVAALQLRVPGPVETFVSSSHTNEGRMELLGYISGLL